MCCLLLQRFQKTYEALEAESVAEKKQLTELHQQRVQSELNEKTRVALDNYMQAIDDNNDVSVIHLISAFSSSSSIFISAMANKTCSNNVMSLQSQATRRANTYCAGHLYHKHNNSH